MTGLAADRTLPWDWYDGRVPDNVEIDPDAYVETTFSFTLFRSTRPVGVRYGAGASSYLGTMFDVGPHGAVEIGDYALVHGARIICDDRVTIGDHALLSWNVVLMDTYRFSTDATVRRDQLAAEPGPSRVLGGGQPARPVTVGAGAWLGFDVVVLPGVTIGAGSIVGAKSVVVDSIPPFTVAAGNPARVLRPLTAEELARGRE